MPFRWLADENFNGQIVRGLLRARPGLDIVRTQDVGLAGADDATLLEWAASQGRILLTHDLKTMPAHARSRMLDGRLLAGVVCAKRALPVALVIEEILAIDAYGEPEEWKGRVDYLPLR